MITHTHNKLLSHGDGELLQGFKRRTTTATLNSSYGRLSGSHPRCQLSLRQARFGSKPVHEIAELGDPSLVFVGSLASW